MPIAKPKPPLSENEREFLALYVRLDEKEARIQAYRDCHCRDWETESDSVIMRRINALCSREDTRLHLAAEQHRHRVAMVQRMAEADGAGFQESAAKATLNRIAVEALGVGIALEEKALGDGDRKSGAGLAKLCEVAAKLTSTDSGQKPLSKEEREEVLKMVAAMGQKKQPAPVPPPAQPPKPQPAEQPEDVILVIGPEIGKS